jgi:CBS domain-containing membrane protein
MNKPLWTLSATDLMSKNLVIVPQDMPLQGAAHLLSRAQVSGAPVVDLHGRCIGVISAMDFLRCVEKGSSTRAPADCFCQSWQILESEKLPEDSVRFFMTANPVMAAANVGLSELARMMLDAHVHRVVVVDSKERPIGIVTSTDILAALTREAANRGAATAPPAELHPAVGP